MKDIPFVFGGAVDGSNFTDRKEELERLTLDLQGGGVNLIISSPRRYGKTSLILKVASNLKERGIMCAYADLYGVSSKESLARILATSLATADTGKIDEILRTIRDFIPPVKITLRPEGSSDYHGGMELELSRGSEDIDDTLMRLYDLPEKIAKKRKKRMVVIFDEFQEVSRIEGEYIEASIRAKIQHHRNVSYVFVGSQRHLFDRMFNDKSRALFGSGKHFRLERIPRNDFAKFIRKKFTSCSISIPDDVVSKILDVTDNHPYYTQHLCREVWSVCVINRSNLIREEYVSAARNLVIRNHAVAYDETWCSLPMGQRSLLHAMAAAGEKQIFTTGFRRRHALGASSTVARSAKCLVDRDVLERGPDGYSIQDPFFEEWVRRMT